MLTVPPVLVLLVFAGYVIWRQTADLDDTELRQLAWGTILDQIWDHTKLTFVTSALVVVIAVPLGIMLTRGKLSRLSPLVSASRTSARPRRRSGWSCCSRSGSASGSGRRSSPSRSTGCCPCCATRSPACRASIRRWWRPARGLGMSSASVLLRVELPLALPVIMTGVRTALVLVVGTATLATFINGGGLGATINSGITLFRFSVMIAGAVLVALLALTIEWLGRLLEVLVKPKGI